LACSPAWWAAWPALLLASSAVADPGAFVEPSAPAPDAPAQPPLGPLPPELVAVALAVADRPLPERMAAISAALLGLPYVTDPIGEGTGIDADPIARYDAFDCLTYTEEVLSLSLAGHPAHAAQVRAELRYGVGQDISYTNRRHFMELQWIPGVIRDGWLRDTTRDYGKTVTLTKEVTDSTWQHWRSRRHFAHTDEQLPKGTMRLSVLPLERAAEVAEQIRPGSIILTVRSDRPGVPLWVTHVSFLVPTSEGGTVMRHATKLGDGGTRDHDLAWYLQHLQGYTNWRVLGISILEPIEPGPRNGLK